MLENIDLYLVEIEQNNMEIFKNLSQAYEAEFSNLTHKMPDKLGQFKIDIFPYQPYNGYLLYYQKTPVGFCIINVSQAIKDFAEFYIIPAVRHKKFGYQLAMMIFNKYPGEWQARQIEGAHHATQFCRSVISQYTNNQYQEEIVPDATWGVVTRQRFKTSNKSD